MNRRDFLSGLGAGIAGTVAGCLGDDTEYEPADSSDGGSSDDGPDAEIIEHDWQIENEGTQTERVAAAGRVENTGDDMLSVVTVSARFYDENETHLETSTDSIRDLDPGTMWRFEITYPGMGEDASKVVKYDIGITRAR